MDTIISFQAYGSNADRALDAATDELYRLDALFSPTNPSGDIYKLNHNLTDTVSSDTICLLTEAVRLSEMTDGAFDCSVGPVVNAWGWYDGSPSVPDPTVLSNAVSNVNFRNIRLNKNTILLQPEMRLDVGGIAKGYSAGVIAETMKTFGITSALIDLGGNIRAVGAKPSGAPWVIGIDDPTNKSEFLATVSIVDSAVVTSGTCQRYFEEGGQRWHHILDPDTGMPADSDLQQVTIITDNDTMADGLSTALFVMGLDLARDFWIQNYPLFDAVFVGSDGSIYITAGLKDSFQCNKKYEVIYV